MKPSVQIATKFWGVRQLCRFGLLKEPPRRKLAVPFVFHTEAQAIWGALADITVNRDVKFDIVAL